jgi:WhiA C-terminal HTH domain/WhiA LAGLIDADG-like domain
MSDPRDRELAEAVRAELAAIDPPRVCCRVAERHGLGRSATGRARSAVVARLAVRLADDGRGGPGARRGDLRPTPGRDVADIDWPAARQHCRAAWLRGRVLSVGSLSLGPAGSHLELVVEPGEASTLARRLADTGVASSVRERRGRGVVTIKGHEAVLALLRWCGASSSVLEVEARLVMRQLQGHLNRVLNAETANLRRSVATSVRQLATIDQLEASGALADLPPLEQRVAHERRAAPEASFSELAARLDVSRARVQRAFARMDAVASGAPADLAAS